MSLECADDLRPIADRRFQNSILNSLPPAEVERLRPHLELVDLERKALVNFAGRIPEFVYFPEGGILSFTLPLPISGRAEFGILGRDGVSSFSAFMTPRASPVDVVVQVGEAKAYRIASNELRVIGRESDQFRDLIFEYLYKFMSQMAYTAVSNARHSLPQRLARWLLMCQDRLDRNEIALTHDFMAVMLGSQRTSVTSTLHILEGEGAIYNKRGIVEVRDRKRLEACAGEAYDMMGRGNPL